ncbi:glycoside hydrolase family 35 protein [Roseateles saccharophilus]|uniref:Beta-galactosidase n=1 Tax=Roseateles saccharophilus TaxID=304 RepID=A0A4V2VP52_ROSSA|nr:beta-galactosidase [Roseateles saccharophilus]MDG0835233.1 beta-galactosidase [Roseateles saccharophilus]TCU86875.1 beta-galactosidase [Roseateles saccharophilus]
MRLPTTLQAGLLLALTLATAAAPAAPTPHFAVDGAQFKLDGKPFVIRSGEMHYPRIPRAAWRERLRMARAMGLNTVTTYAFWSLHEPEPGQWDFSGQNDLRAFVKTAAEEGLNVVLRPGPYVCAEVDFGGFPAWLLRTPGLRVRSMDARYLAATARYYKRLAQEVGDLQSSRGGPILMLQLENEYGSFGRDHDYLRAMQAQMRAAGLDAPLFTSDGGAAHLFDGGTLPDVPAVVNFGGGADDARESVEALASWRPQGVRMAGEYWAGWFDHWGAAHHRTTPEDTARTVDWMLSHGVSFNLYMFHGGTSFGWLAGANYSATVPYQPDTTSYDYDAALDEAGRVTPKFLALREVIAKHTGEALPPLPASPQPQALPPFTLKPAGSLFARLDVLSRAVPSRWVRPMEEFGQNYGYILYRKRLDAPAKGQLVLDDLRDQAIVLAGGRVIGRLDRRLGEKALAVDLPAGTQLDLLVEAMGRVGFGAKLVDDNKGITRAVRLDKEELEGWTVYPLPLDTAALQRLPTGAGGDAAAPGFWRGTLQLDKPADSFLDTRGWGKGQVWVNGHHLGRFWAIGPQQTLYLPASWLKAGANEVLVLTTEPPTAAGATMQGLADPVYETH